MKAPPIKTWSEPVDDHMIVGVARCYVVRRGWVYGLSVFVLHGPPDKQWPWAGRRAACESAAERLRRVVSADHGGRLPPVGRLRDVGGEGVDLSW